MEIPLGKNLGDHQAANPDNSTRVKFAEICGRNPEIPGLWGLWIQHEERIGDVAEAKDIVERALQYCGNEITLWCKLIEFTDKNSRVEVLSVALRANWDLNWQFNLLRIIRRGRMVIFCNES